MEVLNLSSASTNSSLISPASAREDRAYLGFSRAAWIKIGILTALVALAYWPSLRRLWLKTNPINGEPNWGHSLCVPIIGLYYLYINREELLAATVKAAWSGQLILVAGLLIFGYGIWPGQNDFVKDFGLVVTIFGLVLLTCGWQVMKIAWFPIIFLICAIPWPGLLYSKVAGPLQTLAASVSVFVLQLTGVDAQQIGTKIHMAGANGNPDRTLNVAEACAGMRSLMTFISVATAMAFLSARPLWQKLIISLSGIPIAIFCNVMRVAGQGLLDRYAGQEWSKDFAHQFAGMVMLVPAFFMILLVGWVLDKIFVEEVEAPAPRRATEAKSASGNTRAVAGSPATAPRRRQTAVRRDV